MEPSVLYTAERCFLIAAIVFVAMYAIYQWKIAQVKPSLIEEFKREAEAEIRAKLVEKISQQESVIEHNTNSIRSADAWMRARKQEARTLSEPVRSELHEIRRECLKISGASKNLSEAAKLIEALSRHKNFMESMSKSQRSRIQSAAREAKAELKAVDLEVKELLARVTKAEMLLNSSEWIYDQPPIKRERESDNEAMD